MIERLEMLEVLAAHRTDEIVVTTMTTTLQWPLVSRSELDFDFLAFGMGHASDFGLGLALARPERKVVVLKGDGGLLMNLGSLATLGRHGAENLVVLLMENRTYEMTGGQPLPDRVDFTGLARAAGVEGGGVSGRGTVTRTDDLAAFRAALPGVLADPGPHFVVVPVTNSAPLPAVAHTDHAGRIARLRDALGV